jgi:acyl-coenzyme A synthetase/AMP-(fatty) acid ligase
MLFMDMSSAYAFADMVHLTLAFGGRLILAPGVRYIEDIAGIIEKQKVNVLFATSAYMNALMKIKQKPDLSAIEFVFAGGSYVSAHAKGRYDFFLESCGSHARITLGYGLSETAGACILSDPDRKDDSMGRPLKGVRVKLYDEDEDKYYDLSDGPRRGVLFISSPSVSSGRIGNKTFFRLESIEDDESGINEKYLNTYDLVDAGGDGYLKYAGRMNRYFVNNEGIRFDAGLIEAAVSAQPGTDSCAVAPGYDKSIHDTIPVLYYKAAADAGDAVSCAEQALRNVFIDDGLIKDTNLPGQCMITGRIPFNAGGKVDVRKVIKGEVRGRLYKVEPVRSDGRLTDIELIPYVDAPGRRAGRPEELSE